MQNKRGLHFALRAYLRPAWPWRSQCAASSTDRPDGRRMTRWWRKRPSARVAESEIYGRKGAICVGPKASIFASTGASSSCESLGSPAKLRDPRSRLSRFLARKGGSSSVAGDTWLSVASAEQSGMDLARCHADGDFCQSEMCQFVRIYGRSSGVLLIRFEWGRVGTRSWRGCRRLFSFCAGWRVSSMSSTY